MKRVHANEPSRRINLRRRTELAKSEKHLERRKPLRRVGKRGAQHRERMNVARNLVFARDLWRCQAQVASVCQGEAHHAHHVLPRSAGGPDTLDNLLSVCWPCHFWTHSNPEKARALGLLRSRYDRNDR